MKSLSKTTLIVLSTVSALAIGGVVSAASGGLQNWVSPAPKETAPIAAPSENVSPTLPSIPTTGTPTDNSSATTSSETSAETPSSQPVAAPSVPDVAPSTASVTPPAPTAVDPGNGQVTPVLTDQERQDLTIVNPGH